MALQAGIAIPKEVLDYAPLPDDLAQKWKQQLQPSPQAQQAQQAAQALAQKAAVTKIAKDQASANADNASAQLDTVKAQTGIWEAPGNAALQHVETIRKAAEAGALQAGAG